MLSYNERIRIDQEVVLGAEVPKDESAEAKEYRAKAEKDVAEMRAQGLMPDLPLDWDVDD